VARGEWARAVLAARFGAVVAREGPASRWFWGATVFTARRDLALPGALVPVLVGRRGPMCAMRARPGVVPAVALWLGLVLSLGFACALLLDVGIRGRHTRVDDGTPALRGGGRRAACGGRVGQRARGQRRQ